ncbi:hypothetical protein Tco_0706482 [Tanacetum coccineum]|uniref:Uncharacterized protein n=1 Tax=Tanacetum coccineum TaxID=301880 RepID=A0ABQ4Y8H8_9ASTR
MALPVVLMRMGSIPIVNDTFEAVLWRGYTTLLSRPILPLRTLNSGIRSSLRLGDQKQAASILPTNFLKLLVSGVVSRSTRASHPLSEIKVMDKSKNRKKTSKQAARTRESEEYKAEAKNVKPNP